MILIWPESASSRHQRLESISKSESRRSRTRIKSPSTRSESNHLLFYAVSKQLPTSRKNCRLVPSRLTIAFVRPYGILKSLNRLMQTEGSSKPYSLRQLTQTCYALKLSVGLKSTTLYRGTQRPQNSTLKMLTLLRYATTWLLSISRHKKLCQPPLVSPSAS